MSAEAATPLPFDRFQRYSVAARIVQALAPGARPPRVLEVGANVHADLERFLAPDGIVYLDLERPTGDANPARFVLGDGTMSPFRAGAFDAVIALDVIEHVPAARRAAFLAETVRVAARCVVIAAPFRSPEVEAHETRLNAYFRDLHGQDFRWLAEHAARGLPALEETVAQVHALGWAAEVCGAGNLALWAKLMQAHLYVNSEPELVGLRAEVDRAYNAELASRDHAPPVYRHFVVAAADAAELRRLVPTAVGNGHVGEQDLLRLQAHLDRLYEAGTRVRAQRTRATIAAAQAACGPAVSALQAQFAEQEAMIAAQQAARHELERTAALRARLEAVAERLEAAALGLRARRTLPARVRAGLRSAGARAARLGRALGTAVGMLMRLWRSRVHAMRLEPLHDLAADGDGFRSLGDDPQFRLRSSRRRLPRGWVVVEFSVESRGQWLSPKLYVDAGAGFAEHLSFPLPVRAGRRVASTLRLPDRVRALRLDPLTTPGRFALRDVTMRELGLVQLAAALLRHAGTLSRTREEPLRLATRALAIVRTGGPRALVHRLLARERDPSDYQEWIDTYDTLTDVDRTLIRRHVEALPYRPLVSIIMPTYETPEPWLRRAIESVQAQLYPHWELCIADDASIAPHVRRVLDEYRTRDPRIKVTRRARRGHISAASNSALTLARGDFVALLDHDDELAERALYMVAVELNAHPTAEIVYSDEDKLSSHGVRFDPYFKPDWNADLFLAQNLVTHLCVCRSERVREIGGFRVGHEGAQDWDLVMRISERVAAADIRHIPHVLYHWRAVPGSTALAIGEKSYATTAQRRTLADHFARRGESVDILPVAGLCWRIRYPLPRPAPLVSVIIPTRDRLALLRRCIASLRGGTAYPRLELIVIDNQSTEPATRAYLAELTAEPDVTVLRYDAPFHYAAINNLGARHARGEVLVLLNNDVEAITPGWLDEMVRHACRPEIGAVGAMLYYPDDTIQHAGVILGLGTSGVAAHAYSHRPRGYAGQIGRALLAQTVSAVTAACLAVRRSVFEEVGGFDEARFAIAYNDIDFCLRLGERGYRVLWTPYAELYHHESASRGYEDTPAKRERFEREVEHMRRRWRDRLLSDPAYNPNLSLVGESFTLAFPPRAHKPWLAEAEREEPLRALAGGRA